MKVDYEYYTEIYGGTKLAEKDWQRISQKAEQRLDSYTFGRCSGDWEEKDWCRKSCMQMRREMERRPKIRTGTPCHTIQEYPLTVCFTVSCKCTLAIPVFCMRELMRNADEYRHYHLQQTV